MSAGLHRTVDVPAVPGRAQRNPGQPQALILHLARCIDSYKLLGFVTYFSITGSVEEAPERLSTSACSPVCPSVQGCPVCGRRLKLTREGRFPCRE